VSVSAEEGAALFRRFGCSATMPYERFAHALITQPARQLAGELPGGIDSSVLEGLCCSMGVEHVLPLTLTIRNRSQPLPRLA
jgi:hypothetical protein